MNTYVQGTPLRIYTDPPFSVSGTATDPTAVALRIEKPDQTEVTYTLAAAQVTKAGTGIYEKEIIADQPGTWTYRWEGTGAVQAVDEEQFYVTRSVFG